MKPSRKLPSIRIVIFATIILMALGFAPNIFVSSSHRQIAGAPEPAPRLRQATAMPRGSIGKKVDTQSSARIGSVVPDVSPWQSFGLPPLNFGGSAYSARVPTITVDPEAFNTAHSASAVALAGNPNCDALVPSGGDDALQIATCLDMVGHVTLTQNTFLIYQPIQGIGFANGVRIIGAGKNTKIYAQFTCGDPRFLDGGDYKIPIEIRRSPNSVLSNFTLNLEALRKDCGHGGNNAISINKSENSQVTGVKITGSRYGDPGYTTGWVHGGGISVVNSSNSVITNNVVKDVGYASGGISVGFQGIGIFNSANSLVQNNTVTRVGFGIEIVNGSPSIGYTGDSSGTVVTGNTITGAALIGCPECSHGRAIKFQACSVGDELPIKNVTLTYNYATEFGGQSGGSHAGQGGSGLHLTCGVQYSRIENNTFIGAPTAEMGLLVDSMFPAGTPPNPTHHNTINFNTFYSGRGESGCNENCSDVEFNNLGPDQIGLDRGSRGNNTLKPVSGGHAIRVRFTHGCSQYSHAWFVYPSGQTFVYQGQSITVAGAGILPPNFFSVIRFSFRNSSGVEIASYTTQRSQSNCVVNQELAYINPSLFSPDLYAVYANYYDGNTDVLYIPNDPIGTLDVRATQSNQPPVASHGGPYSGTVGSAVQFNGSGSFDPDGFITSYQWNFGDGATGSGATPTHAYSAANTYTVTLTVTDNGGAQSSASTTANIGVGNQPPVASPGGPYSGTVGSAVQFNGSGSFDPDGFITSYQWNFGDGATGSGATPTHAYSAANTYTVTLTVTDNGGAQGSASTTATIGGGGSSGPVGYWKFDEGSGTFAGDSSGNGLNGTLQNGPTWMAGRVNGALNFNGFNDYVQVGSQPALMMTNALTAGAWIYPTSSVSTRTIVNREGEYNIGELEGVISWAFSNTNPGWNWVSTGYSPPLFQWTHIAVTYSNGIIKTYANGVLVHTYNGAGSIVDSSPPENDFRIGSRQCSFCSEYFQGGIDEVRMYNRALSAAEIQALVAPPSGNDTVWVEDSLPAGAIPAGDFEGWNWIGSNPTPFSGSLANQSNLVAGVHQHYFYGATDKLVVNTGNVMVAYVYLDPASPPSEVMLQWNSDFFGWNHRAYWGANNIPWGTDGTASRRFIGPLPAAGGWVRLEVPANLVGLEGLSLNGLAFTLFDGRATWDHAGKAGSGSGPTPVGYWKFDEGSGTIASDASGNGLTGTLTNGPVWTTGRVSGAVNFDGLNDYVQVGAQPSLVMTNTMTISAWIKPTGTGIIVNKEGEYEVERMSDGIIYWAIANANPGWFWVSTGYAPPVNQWSHLAIVYDNGVVRTYGNGALVHTYNGAGSIGDAHTAWNDFRIGGRQCTSCAEYFQGGIDEVRMYNTALSATDIQTLANP